jgi:V-type H+-transporting ATPase subunit C
MTTLAVVMNRSAEKEWLETYQNLGSQIAQYGPSNNRGSRLGSPVVPDSSRKLIEDGDMCIYSVTILKGSYNGGRFVNDEYEEGVFHDYTEQFKRVCRESRFIVRDFEYNPDKQAEKRRSEAQLESDTSKLWRSFNAWTKVHFGIAYCNWMHIKMIRLFVESVLRYGLPVNFTFLVFKPHKYKDKKLRDVLGKMFAHLDSQSGGQDDDDAGETASLGLHAGEFYPYVSNAFFPRSA